MVINNFFSELDQTLFASRALVGYWHAKNSWTALLMDDGLALTCSIEEHSAGHWFEVFTIKWIPKSLNLDWTLFEKPALVASVIPLWRSEWLEEGATGPTVGMNPKTQYGGRGPVPDSALMAANVQAGFLISDHTAPRVVVAASAAHPFQIDLGVTPEEISEILSGFWPVNQVAQ